MKLYKSGNNDNMKAQMGEKVQTLIFSIGVLKTKKYHKRNA